MPKGKNNRERAGTILNIMTLITTDGKQVYQFIESTGRWKFLPDGVLLKAIARKFDADAYTSHEVLRTIKVMSYEEDIQWNREPGMVPLTNGVYNLEDGKLVDYRRDMYFSQCLPFPYDPDADCPQINESLEKTMDEIDQQTFYEMCGYLLTMGQSSVKSFFFLVGEADTGKSTLTRVIQRFMGDFSTGKHSIRDLSSRFKRHEILDQWALISHEESSNDLSNAQIRELKQLTDQMAEVPVWVEKKGKDGYYVINRVKFVVATNWIPRNITQESSETFDYALFRRLVAMKCRHQYDSGKITSGTSPLERMTTEKELSGLFNRALKGIERLKERPFQRRGKTKHLGKNSGKNGKPNPNVPLSWWKAGKKVSP